MRPGYLQEPLLNQTDVSIRDLVVSLEGGNQIAINTFIAQVTEQRARMLLCFARRMAIYSVRTLSPVQVRFGVIAAMLSLRASDRREVLVILGVLFDAGKRSGGDSREIFEEVAKVVPSDGVEMLRSFLRRGDLESILEKMGFGTGHDEGGKFEYQNRAGSISQEQLSSLMKRFRSPER
jgi:hypothetical protein